MRFFILYYNHLIKLSPNKENKKEVLNYEKI